MAKTILTLCDECLADGTEVPGATYGLTIQTPGAKAAPYDIDACDMHAEPIRALLKSLGEYGQRSDRKPPLPRVSAAPGVPAEAVAAATEAVGAGHVCPVPGCGHVTPKRTGLRSHISQTHGMTVAEAEGTANTACPEKGCGRMFGKPQGLSNHLSRTHQYASAKAKTAVQAAFGAHE